MSEDRRSDFSVASLHPAKAFTLLVLEVLRASFYCSFVFVDASPPREHNLSLC